MQANWGLSKFESKPGQRTLGLLLCLGLALSMATIACTVERRKSDAELALTPQQAAGRRVYDERCDRCHEPYATRGKNGPGLKGIFKRPYMPGSGLPANDERATDIIRYGRSHMPGFSDVLTQQQIDDLLVYMHTL
jgi:mono/diheme cytochrome c family protein